MNKAPDRLLSLLTAGVLAAIWSGQALAQTQEDESEGGIPRPTLPQSAEDAGDDSIDEVVVLGRFISSSQQLVNERMNDAFATDLLGADTISRLGDSTVADALRRVPGLTLVQDKFIYIRGLGERYSKTTLNGAEIPSPDLTRNVIPLDVFPTSVVQSLKVQKAYDPSLSANFGGGSVDIRTKGIPDAFTFNIEAGLGVNTENPSNVLSYAGGSDDEWGTDDGTRALPGVISAGLDRFLGNPSTTAILPILRNQDPTADTFDAETINRDFALALYRNIGIEEESSDPDYKVRASVGNKFLIGSDWEAGFAFGGSYDTSWRWRETRTASFALPEEQNGVREETTRSVQISGTANFGVSFTDDHSIETTSLFLRNTDDETEVFDFFNENRPRTGDRGFRDYRIQFEERNMFTNQVRGTHYLGDATRDKLPFVDSLLGWLPTETRVEWFWSESWAKTNIPSEIEITADTETTDTGSGIVDSDSVRLGASAANYRFTDLDDEVENWGWSGMLPLEFGDNYVEVSGGWDHGQKARKYEQAQFAMGFLGVSDPAILDGSLDQVFSEQNITARLPDNPLTVIDESRNYVNDFEFSRVGANSNSYLAATMTDSVWGSVDWTLADSWRFVAGARWEDYRQLAVEWDPYSYSIESPPVTTDPEELADRTFNSDEIYPAASITYMGNLWADTFQLRLGYSETVVRPDLRELTDSSYVDPLTDVLTRGSSGLVPTDVRNIDLRAEWFFGNGDNLTLTLFDKDLGNPIEFVEIPASDTTIARQIQNLESASVQGLEAEFLKELAFLGGFFDTLFLQGNVTAQWDRELVAGPNGTDLFCALDDSDPSLPSRDCQLSGASEYVANLTLGYDSRDSKHTASLIYNVFGERLFTFGRFGPDAYEQPFHSVDITYFWYPTDRITLKAKAQNILNESIEIEREGVVVFEEDPGTTFAIAFSWGF